MIYKRITIIGLGLIGGSLARAIRSHLPEVQLSVVDRSEDTLAYARENELAHLATNDMAEAVREAQLVILAVPIPALLEVTRAISPLLPEGAVVTDVASVKRIIVEEVRQVLPERFALVPAHPIAGSEKSGVASGREDLFDARKVVLTPDDPHLPDVHHVADFWQRLGALVDYMPAELHDQIYGCVSHLPQFISICIRAIFENIQVAPEYIETFRRFTRLGNSPYALWQGIFDANSDNISSGLEVFLQVIHQIRSELENGVGSTEKLADDALIYGVLVPRIVATAQIATTLQLERDLGLPVKRYGGTGFIDFTCPAVSPPDDQLALISTHAAQVAQALDQIVGALNAGMELID